MLTFTAATACLCVVVSFASAARVERAEMMAIDFEEIVDKMKAVDRYNGEDDQFIVFETDGSTLVEASSPEPVACSLETLQGVLLDCPKRGKMCIALYKFNYPRAIGSSTIKGKSILMLASDKVVMGKSLGSSFKATQVTMAVVPFVWQKLQPIIKSNSISPAVTVELSDSDEIRALEGDKVWGKIKAASSRVDANEGKSFIQHAKEQIAKAAGKAVVPIEQPNTGKETKLEPATTQASGQLSVPTAPATAVAVVDTKKIAKEVEEILEKRIEATSRKIAREEVGMAIRKLGTDIGEVTRSVGKLWIDKSRQ